MSDSTFQDSNQLNLIIRPLDHQIKNKLQAHPIRYSKFMEKYDDFMNGFPAIRIPKNSIDRPPILQKSSNTSPEDIEKKYQLWQLLNHIWNDLISENYDEFFKNEKLDLNELLNIQNSLPVGIGESSKSTDDPHNNRVADLLQTAENWGESNPSLSPLIESLRQLAQEHNKLKKKYEPKTKNRQVLLVGELFDTAYQKVKLLHEDKEKAQTLHKKQNKQTNNFNEQRYSEILEKHKTIKAILNKFDKIFPRLLNVLKPKPMFFQSNIHKITNKFDRDFSTQVTPSGPR